VGNSSQVVADVNMEGRVRPHIERGSVEVLPQESFLRMLQVEQRRTERSGRGFLLMRIAAGEPMAKRDEALAKVTRTLMQSTRETDIVGWYQQGGVVGVVLTEIESAARAGAVAAISTRTERQLSATLSPEQFGQISISFHAFPEEEEEKGDDGSIGNKSEFARNGRRRRVSLAVKRCMDFVGAVLAVVLFFPLMIVIAIAIKLNSKGPVLFRQQRIGQHGHAFTFLKFRSMYTETDQAIHEAYMKEFIAGEPAADGVYKIKRDPRVTSVGRILRKTSVDELPQLFNVLQGTMSLVGPRPPIRYEVNRYAIWHKRRFLTVKPGITGLWQVKGRSRVAFDEQVRLDLRYAESWSLWLDIKILLQTPLAVLIGDGAY
jgi:exopolysaccharide biosynthesis polyprenyl glycosylphosphotransferase